MSYQTTRRLLAYTIHPSVQQFAALRAAYIAEGVASAYDEIFFVIRELIDKEQLEAALETLYGDLPKLLLSPRAHWWAAHLENELGDSITAQLEQAIGDRLVEGILSTGNGSADRPFTVLRVDDEYDALSALGKTVVGQALLADMACDVLSCDDGTNIWFDISALRQQSVPDCR